MPASTFLSPKAGSPPPAQFGPRRSGSECLKCAHRRRCGRARCFSKPAIRLKDTYGRTGGKPRSRSTEVRSVIGRSQCFVDMTDTRNLRPLGGDLT